jgi:hypothetical protein
VARATVYNDQTADSIGGVTLHQDDPVAAVLNRN